MKRPKPPKQILRSSSTEASDLNRPADERERGVSEPSERLAAGGNDEEDSKTLSVTRLAEISEVREWEFLGCGVDSLDLGFSVEWDSNWPRISAELERFKVAAEGTKGELWPGKVALILPTGKPPMYRWHVQFPQFHLFLGKAQRPVGETPNVIASINAETLWHLWVPGAVELVRREIEGLGGRVVQTKCSRCDLAADFLIPDGVAFEFLQHHRVSRSRKTDARFDGSDLETYYVGSKKSPIEFRIYDKSKEVLRDGKKLWFFDVWELEPCGGVWRIEAQLRRQFWRETQTNSIEELLANLGGTWSYLTEQWLCLRLSDNRNVSRRTVHPFWSDVQRIADRFGAVRPVVRSKSRPVGDIGKQVAQIAGRVVGLAATCGIDNLDEALCELERRVRVSLPPAKFAKKYQTKSIQLGRTICPPSGDAANIRVESRTSERISAPADGSQEKADRVDLSNTGELSP